MNDGGVCRTAPATPGLLNIRVKWNVIIINIAGKMGLIEDDMNVMYGGKGLDAKTALYREVCGTLKQYSLENMYPTSQN